jgi:hypothetical protein
MSQPSIRVLIKDAPTRSFALATETYALVLKNTYHSNENSRNASNTNLTNGQTHEPLCLAEFGLTTEVDLTAYRSLSFKDVYGTLGLLTIDDDVFLCVVTSAVKVAEVRPGETVQRINTVEFRKLHTVFYKYLR